MTGITSQLWAGLSNSYNFEVYDSSVRTFNNVSAVYIFARCDSAASAWTPLYIGETAMLGTRIAGHEKWLCAVANGVTHIHVCRINGDLARRNAEHDLLARWSPPCNG